MENAPILTEKRPGGILLVTLNSPPLNLQTLDSMDLLERIVEDIAVDAAVRALVLAGAGGRVFCAGSDVKEFPSLRGSFVEQKLRRENAVFTQLSELSVPTVAAMGGSAMGGGYEIALCCDFRIMSETAQIGLPEINLGNFPGSGGPMRLARLIGPARAMELMSLGTSVDAQTALRMGLVHAAVPREQVLDTAFQMAARFAALPRGYAAAVKELIYAGTYETPAQAADHAMKTARRYKDFG